MIEALEGRNDGSSPRMRGILGTGYMATLQSRFIPADAGNTIQIIEPVMTEYGSSPRMRGIPACPPRHTAPSRFIPADAGNTSWCGWVPLSASVHPRGCGEYWRRNRISWVTVGSSPRMRGIHQESAGRHAPDRFIPADAGNTNASCLIVSLYSVHPRGCGEYAHPRSFRSSLAGSSPRMRGIRCGRSWAMSCARFIPADAGNTILCAIISSASAVHPRGCGEYSYTLGERSPKAGSSPRMRGIRKSSAVATPSFTVHPRGCGEYTSRK